MRHLRRPPRELYRVLDEQEYLLTAPSELPGGGAPARAGARRRGGRRAALLACAAAAAALASATTLGVLSLGEGSSTRRSRLRLGGAPDAAEGIARTGTPAGRGVERTAGTAAESAAGRLDGVVATVGRLARRRRRRAASHADRLRRTRKLAGAGLTVGGHLPIAALPIAAVPIAFVPIATVAGNGDAHRRPQAGGGAEFSFEGGGG